MSTSKGRMSSVAQYRDENAWAYARRAHITGSDVAALFGLHPFRSAMDVWEDKVGLSTEKPVSRAMLRGRYLEPLAADLYSEITGRSVRKQQFRVHPKHSVLAGTVDRQVLRGADVDTTGILEIKAPGVRNFSRIKREGVPDYVTLQLQAYLSVYGYAWGAFAVFNAEDWQLVHFDVEAKPAVQQMIIEAAEKFWRDHVETREPPNDNSPLLVDLPEVSGVVQFRTDDQFRAVTQDYIEASALVKEAEAVKEQARTRIVQLVGAGQFNTYEMRDAVRVYYSQLAGRAQHAETLKAVKGAKPLDRITVARVLADHFGATSGDVIDRLNTEAALDFSQYEKIGKPIEQIRVYPLRREEE